MLFGLVRSAVVPDVAFAHARPLADVLAERVEVESQHEGAARTGAAEELAELEAWR